MFSFSDCQTIIEERIEQLNIGRHKPAELYQPIAYILGLGGKRIRPVVTLMACNLFTDDVTPAVNPALAIEVFHNFTLVHDDIMDNAALRRNQPTVHSRWNDNIAILSGDAMQVVAYQLLCDSNPHHLKSLLGIFNETALQVCEGQQYDMNFACQPKVSLADYLHMIELKTSVLLAASLKIGALCGGASDNDAQKLYEFGRNLGLAFQIQDDYLDVYADQDKFGKTVGGDIAENKKTFLLIKALELAQGQHAIDLKRHMENELLSTNEKIELIRNIYNELNIPSLAKEKIAEFSKKAFDNLSVLGIPDSRKNYLRLMAQELMNREK
jgi:geranylgeranyl diphosphate synthase type II